MTNLTDLLPAGAGGKQVSFTADGSISQGNTVALQTNGTVKAITETSASETMGSATTFEAASTEYVAVAYDSNAQKSVFVYRDGGNSSYATAVVATVSGTSISFGTPVVIDSGDSSTDLSVTYDVNADRIVAAYGRFSTSVYEGRAAVGTVSGTSISFGTPVAFNTSSNTRDLAIAYDANAQKVVIVFKDGGNSSKGTAVVGTVSGTSISLGSEVVYETGFANDNAIAYDASAQKVVVAYRDSAASGYGKAVVGTVSGTSISFGSSATFESAAMNYTSIAYDSVNEKVVIAYTDEGNSYYSTAVVGTVSGTSISFGTPAVVTSSYNEDIAVVYDSNAQKTVVMHQGTSQYGQVKVGTVSGTSITFGSAVSFGGSIVPEHFGATFDSNENKVVMGYQGTSNYGQGVVFQNASSSTNSADFIGIADAAISDTASGKITIKGGIAANGLSSLTPGSTYYVQRDGTLATSAATPSVTAGKALSATSINLDYSS